jgi:hypothetical protein
MSALPAVLAVLIAAALVLFDVSDAPPAPTAATTPAQGSAHLDAGLFSALERGEPDPGRVPERQRSAAAVLLALTLAAAGVLGGGIYLGLSALR